MSYVGDFQAGATVRVPFNTNQLSGPPYTLASGTVHVYKAGNTTESAAGVSTSVDFDSRTGLHVVTIDTSADAFYASGEDYFVVVTAGTVDSVSVVGTCVGHFSIENRPSTSAPSAEDIADAVWDEALAGHATAGSAGAGLAAASSAGDPWATLLPGSYTAGQAGHIIGTYLDAAITSRSSHTAANVASLILVTPAQKLVTDGSGRVTVGSNADKTGYALTVTPPTAAAIADAVWDEVASGHVTAGTYGLLLGSLTLTAIADSVWDEPLAGHVTDGTAGEALGSFDPSDIALQVWDIDMEDIVADGSIGVFVIGKMGLITSQGIVTASIVSSGEVIPIWKSRSRTITFIIPMASIDLTDHVPKFGMTRFATAEAGTETLEVVGTLTPVGTDYHLVFELSTAQTNGLAKSPAPTHPYRVNTAESYSYTWSISATDGSGSCPQLAEGLVQVKASDTSCATS